MDEKSGRVMVDLLVKKFRSGFKLFSTAFIYTSGNVLNNALPFLMMPILTRMLSPTDYGYTAMYAVLCSFAAAFVGLSIHGSIGRYYFNRTEVVLEEYIGNCLLLLMSSAVIVSVLVLLFGEQIAALSSFPQSFLFFVILTVFFQFIVLLRMTIWQLEKKAFSFIALQITVTFLTLAGTIGLIYFWKLQWQARIFANVAVQGMAALFCLGSLIRDKWIKITYNKKYFDSAMRFGLPLIPHALGGIIITMTDRFLLTNMTGLESTGLYSVGVQLGMVIGVLVESFQKAYSPWLFEMLNKNDDVIKTKIVKGTYLYFIGVFIAALIYGFLGPQIFGLFLGEKFIQASKYVIWLSLGAAFNGMYYMVGTYIFYAHKTKFLAFSTLTSGVLNLIISYFMIKSGGALGAAQATCIAFFISFVLTWILSSMSYSMPWLLGMEKLFMKKDKAGI